MTRPAATTPAPTDPAAVEAMVGRLKATATTEREWQVAAMLTALSAERDEWAQVAAVEAAERRRLQDREAALSARVVELEGALEFGADVLDGVRSGAIGRRSKAVDSALRRARTLSSAA